MKILGISCSPRLQGNTVMLLNHVLDGARQEGGETELYSVSGKTMEPCRGCMTCRETGECVIRDDMSVLHDKLLEAQGIVIGTPIYFYSMTAQAKTIMDRTIALNRPERTLANKVGGAVVVAGSLGLSNALKDIYFYYVTRQMLPANYVAAYAGPEGAVMSLEKCLKAASDLGRQMVRLAEKKFEYPGDIGSTHFAYGTHTK